MSCNENIAIRVSGVNKTYPVYARRADRLKQLLFGWGRRFYTPFHALSEINFEVRKGESVGIIGRNGCGKSTLLQIVAGTLAPTRGRVETSGRVAALLELGAGFNPEFTGRENVFLNAAILGLTREETEAHFDEIASFADIGEFLDRPVKQYSSGMFMRLAFAVQAHIDADIILIDEALAVGDIPFQVKCFAHLRKLKDRGVATLLVSHDIGTIRSFCDRVLYLRHGRQINYDECAATVRQFEEEIFEGKLVRRVAENETANVAPPTELEASTVSSVASFASTLRNQAVAFSQRAGDQARRGTGAVRIVSFLITDAAGNPTETVNPEEEVCGGFLLRSDINHYGDLHLSIMVHNKTGGPVMVIRDSHFHRAIRLPSGSEWVGIKRFKLPLQAGEYYCTAGVMLFEAGKKYFAGAFNFDGAEIADLIPVAAYFSVQSYTKHPIPAPVLNETALNLSPVIHE